MAARVPFTSPTLTRAPGAGTAPSVSMPTEVPRLPGGTADQTQVQPRVPPTAQAVPPEQIATPKPLTFADYERDYHADDREAVLAGMRPGAAPAAAPAPATPQYQYVEGVDMGKMRDTTWNSPKYQAMRILASGGDKAAAAQAVGGYWLDDERMVTNSGEVIDTRRDATGANGQPGANVLQWLSIGNVNDQGQPQQPAAPAAGGGFTIPGVGTIGPDGSWTPDPSAMQVQGRAVGAGVPLAGASGRPSPAASFPVGGAPAAAAGGAGLALPSGVALPTDSGMLSGVVEGGLSNLAASGMSPFGGSIASTLQRLIAQGGMTPDITQQLIGARTDAARAQQSLLADAESTLASRGLASLPGAPQGVHADAIGRITEQVAPEFARAIRDIETHALDVTNDNLMQSLSLATGLSIDQASTMLEALGQGTQRQIGLAQIALGELSQNREWNQFLATHNLDRVQVEENIATGRINTLIPLLKLFLEGGATVAGGTI